jgi:hypothetical protein
MRYIVEQHTQTTYTEGSLIRIWAWWMNFSWQVMRTLAEIHCCPFLLAFRVTNIDKQRSSNVESTLNADLTERSAKLSKDI